GRIEGNVNSSVLNSRNLRSDYDSPHAAPVSEKIGLEDEGVARINRKLSDDFLFLKRKVFGEMKTKANKKSIKSDSVRKILKEKQKTRVEETSPTRTSPRLCKRMKGNTRFGISGEFSDLCKRLLNGGVSAYIVYQDELKISMQRGMHCI
ncbi:hypothetical protein HID58_070635, partial [Brassica napus]